MRFILLDSYMSVINGSVGTKMFRSCWFVDVGKKRDITVGGKLACALYVSSVLKIFDLIGSRHATVDGTVEDLEKFGWKKYKQLRVGSILVWEAETQEGEVHKHIGFYMGKGEAISNSWEKKTPQRHEYTYGGKRKVEAIYWNRKLE